MKQAFDWGRTRAVLFDLDGTLVDSAPDLAHAANQLRAAHGLEALPLQDFRPMAGAGARGMLSIAFGVQPDEERFVPLRDAFLDLYEACIHDRTRVFDHMETVLPVLERNGLPWGIVTNKAHRFTSLIAQRTPLFARAGAIISGDTTPHAKPHPAPLLAAASQLGVAAQDCIYVGDDLRDVQAGRAAGMGTVAALYGYLGKDGEATAWGADACIESPADLLKLLRLV